MKDIVKIINDFLGALFIIMIKVYKYTISPLLGPRCRYLPTCSDYAIESIKEHGVARGVVYTIRRLLRCHPFGGDGLDPVPKSKRDI